MSRVTDDELETKRTVTCAVRAAHFGGGDVGRVDRDEPRLDRLAALLALADRAVEAVIDVARQQVLERAPVALGERRDDHLVGGARAGDEMLGVEARIGGGDGVEPGGERRARLGDALPARSGSARPASTGFGAATGSAGRGGSATTLSVAGRTGSRAEYGS